MPKQDWIQIINIFENKQEDYIENFLITNEIFCPSETNVFGF